MSEICDFGEFARYIVPPECLTAKPARTVRQPRRWVVSKVDPPTAAKDWTPLIVIGNKNAGNNDGAVFLNGFRGVLNPAQIIDLSQSRMEDALEWCHILPGVRCTVLVAGGDGTIGWVLNTVDKLKLDPEPIVALLPLGTGNDLARTLGYGAGGDVHDVREILRILSKRTSVVHLDRWKVSISSMKQLSNKALVAAGGPAKEIFIQNYLSIGVDALVTYNFHRTRESKSVPFSGRLFNKTLYFLYGTKDVVERECKDLDQILELDMDGRRIELPNIESVVVLNIPSWGAGVRPWGLGAGHNEFPMPEYDDGKLEVFCIYSSFHIAQMQVGLSEPHRLGQAKEVRLRLKGRMPMQTDGEPWIQGPADITIKHHKQVDMLKVLPQDE